MPLGPRVTDVRSVHQRALLGWRGVVAGWDADAAVMQSTSRATSDFASGFLDTTRLTDAFATGLINPFGDSGPAGNALLASTEIRGRGGSHAAPRAASTFGPAATSRAGAPDR